MLRHGDQARTHICAFAHFFHCSLKMQCVHACLVHSPWQLRMPETGWTAAMCGGSRATVGVVHMPVFDSELAAAVAAASPTTPHWRAMVKKKHTWEERLAPSWLACLRGDSSDSWLLACKGLIEMWFYSELTTITECEHNILRRNDSLEVAGNLWNVPTPLRTSRSQWERSFVSGCMYHVTKTEVF